MLSVVILAYRNGPVLDAWVSDLHSRLGTLTESWEILLVVNQWPGEQDPARDVAHSLEKKFPKVRTVTLPKAGGYGWDVKTGLEAARGEILAYVDGDGQIPAESVPAAFRKLTSEGLDLVKAHRIHREDGTFRSALSKIFNFGFRIFFGVQDPDINAKPKIFRRKFYESIVLRSDDWFIDAEIMIWAKQLKLKIGELPIAFHALMGRRSLVGFKTIFEFCKNFWIYLFQKPPR